MKHATGLIIGVIVCGAAAAGALWPSPAAGGAGRERAEGRADPIDDALVDLLRDALVKRQDAGQIRLMQALRQLRDPALRPLFAQMAAGERPLLRIHGILGLAELETPARVDLLLVKKITEPRGQLLVLGEAMRSGLLETAQLQDVIRWPGLDDTQVVLILGKLRRSGAAIDAAELKRYAEGKNQAAAAFAAMELLQAGGEAPAGGAESPALDRVLSLNPADREDSEALSQVLTHIREERLTRLAPLARKLWERLEGDSAGRGEAARTLLTLRPADEETLKDWGQTYRAADLAGRIRLGIWALEVALAGPKECSAEVFAPMLADQTELVRTIGAMGGAVIHDTSVTPAAMALIAQRHRASAEWALQLAERRPPEEAGLIRLRVVEVCGSALKDQPDLFEPVARGACALAREVPDAWRDQVRSALNAGDEAQAMALLAGAFQVQNTGIGAMVEGLLGADREASMPRASGLICLLRAKHAPQLGAGEFNRLAAIAMGTGTLPEAYRVQAAWLALKCRGEQRVALARVLADGP